MSVVNTLIDPIPAVVIPHHIDYLKAKSADLGGDTLAQHTWQVLRRLSDQYHLRPDLAQFLNDERLWHRMYWACFFHDFGKAAQGFQERLQAPKVPNDWSEGKHRHEILSLAFVEWLFPPGHFDRLPILSAIMTHHKDIDAITAKYGIGKKTDGDEHRRVDFLVSQVSTQVVDDLWRWLVDYGMSWQQALGLPMIEVMQPSNRASFGTMAIHRALRDVSEYLLTYEYGYTFSREQRSCDVHYRGLIFTSDHAASAGTPAFPKLTLGTDHIIKIVKGRTLRSHQQAMQQVGVGSGLLIAPTGSGKTEAALLWAIRQLEQRPIARLFYTLPYQASMNAMAERLSRDLFGISFSNFERNQQITLQHSRALLKFYQDMRELDSGSGSDEDAEKAMRRGLRHAAENARQRQDLARLSFYPIQVFSPYQMLKALFGLKGYETLMVDYTNALFIFDEIHAYDANRLALIIGMIRWLATEWGARFLVMTATLPPMVREMLLKALHGCVEITASDADFVTSQRHTVQLHDADLTDPQTLTHVVDDFQAGKSVLVCVNTIARAQTVCRYLQRQLGTEAVVLLHGRFNARDRTDREKELIERVGVGVKDRRPSVIVATQVVEVSLNIDLDTLYTDPAPLEALLQRFGRVNRGRGDNQPKCPVHVMKQPLGESECKPYIVDLVTASLEVLARHCDGRAIDEAQVTAMLGEIYQGEPLKRWLSDYQVTEKQVQNRLNSLYPYKAPLPNAETDFYKLFDGIQVLSVDCETDYDNAREQHDYLGALLYLVNLSWKQYHILKPRGLVLGEDESGIPHVNVPYNSDWGLDLNAALHQEDHAL